MFPLLRRMARLFSVYRWRLAALALFVLLPKLGDLLVPFFGARVFDALAAHESPERINALILQAAAFWVVHGNVLPFACDWFERRFFGLPARQHVSEYGLASMLQGLPIARRQEFATLHQAVLEEGENKLMDFMDVMIRTAVPTVVMSLCALAILFCWLPLLGGILLAGGVVDIGLTLYANGKLRDRFALLQTLRFRRQQQHREIFNGILGMLGTEEGAEAYRDYSSRYGELTALAVRVQTTFFGFRLGRDILANGTNCLTWLVGAWCVYTGEATIGALVVVTAWAARAGELFGLVTIVHRAWLDAAPAIKAFFAVIDAPTEGLPAQSPSPAPARSVVLIGMKQAS